MSRQRWVIALEGQLFYKQQGEDGTAAGEDWLQLGLHGQKSNWYPVP